MTAERLSMPTIKELLQLKGVKKLPDKYVAAQKQIEPSPLFLIVLFAAALFLVWTANTDAATLYERSLEKLQAGIGKVSPNDFTFVVLGDSRGNDDIFKKALALAKTYNPLFILHGGDYSDQVGAPLVLYQ